MIIQIIIITIIGIRITILLKTKQKTNKRNRGE